MKKTILYVIFGILLIGLVSAQTMTREIPSSANTGQTFTVRYKTTDATGNFGVLIDDDISGGCTPNHVATGFLSPATYSDITFTAPSSAGSCTFTGNYQFADASGEKPETNFPTQSITISGESCTDTTWSPSTSTVCSGTSFTQTSNCGNTRTATGTKDCTQPCTDTSWTPATSTACEGQSFTQTSNCGNTRTATGTKDCVAPPETCEERLNCKMWEQCNTDETGCQIAKWVIIVAIIVGIMIFYKFMGGK